MTEDRTPLNVGREEIEAVDEFPYLGSQIESSSRVTRCGEAYSTAIQGFGGTQKTSLSGKKPQHLHNMQGVPIMCPAHTPIWGYNAGHR